MGQTIHERGAVARGSMYGGYEGTLGTKPRLACIYIGFGTGDIEPVAGPREALLWVSGVGTLKIDV